MSEKAPQPDSTQTPNSISPDLPTARAATELNYTDFLTETAQLIQAARQAAARSVNTVMTATYWEMGRRIVEWEQNGKERAEYGSKLLQQLSKDLTAQLGRGFSERNLAQMRRFYLGWKIPQTVSAKLTDLMGQFPLPWSHYNRMLSPNEALLAAELEKTRKLLEERRS